MTFPPRVFGLFRHNCSAQVGSVQAAVLQFWSRARDRKKQHVSTWAYIHCTYHCDFAVNSQVRHYFPTQNKAPFSDFLFNQHYLPGQHCINGLFVFEENKHQCYLNDRPMKTRAHRTSALPWVRENRQTVLVCIGGRRKDVVS